MRDVLIHQTLLKKIKQIIRYSKLEIEKYTKWLSNLKSIVDKLDGDKLLLIPVHLSKLSDVVERCC